MPSSSSSQKVKRGECSHPLWNVSKCFLFLFWASASVKTAVTLPKGDRIVQQGSRLMIQNTHKYTHTFAESRNTPTLIHCACEVSMKFTGVSHLLTHLYIVQVSGTVRHENTFNWNELQEAAITWIKHSLAVRRDAGISMFLLLPDVWNEFLLKCLWTVCEKSWSPEFLEQLWS